MRSFPGSIAAVLVVCCVECAFIAPAGAQLKLTSGAVALLVNQTKPENVATLQQAVTDADVEVRRVAARVAGVIERRDLAPLLLEQLAREKDDAAAAEELRAVLFIQGAQALPEASASGMRLGGRARLAGATTENT